MNKSTEDQVVTEAKKSGDSKPDTSPKAKSDIVRFWSSQTSHMVAVSGRNIEFKNHVILLKGSDPDAKVLRELRGPHIKEVLDRPFEDEKTQARFNKFLSGLIFTGERGEASKRGVIAIRALFTGDESNGALEDGKLNPDLLIVRAIKTKSFKEGV